MVDSLKLLLFFPPQTINALERTKEGKKERVSNIGNPESISTKFMDELFSPKQVPLTNI